MSCPVITLGELEFERKLLEHRLVALLRELEMLSREELLCVSNPRVLYFIKHEIAANQGLVREMEVRQRTLYEEISSRHYEEIPDLPVVKRSRLCKLFYKLVCQ